MEPWQIDHLKGNLSQLLKKTTCNDALLRRLLSEDIFAKVDIESITSTPDGFGQASMLYDIAETRKYAFVAIAKALAEDGQLEACKIFTDGLALHLTRPNIKINFLMNNDPLSDYLDVDQLNETMQVLTNTCSSKQIIEIFENVQSNNKIIKLVNRTIPVNPPLYIPRTLFKRLVVKVELFDAVCPDIFVFKDIEINKLLKLFSRQSVAPSSSQLVRIDTRFIRLDNDEDWEDMANIAQASIHLIKFEERTNNFILEQTLGDSRVIQDYLEKDNVDGRNKLRTILGEDAFVDNVLNTKWPWVCICDLPGTGKTVLLARLANKIAENYPNRLVAFIPLSNFIQRMSTVETLPKVNAEFAKNALLNFLSTSPLAALLLDKILNKQNISVELFFDGFDEVQREHIEFTKNFLSKLTFSFPNTRVYITSRPHLRAELEASFQSITYHILPFTPKIQMEYLVKYWTSESKQLCQQKLFEFANFLVNQLTSGMTKQDMLISGVPLICRILADVYSRNAQIYSKSTRAILLESFCQLEKSLPGLYKQYMEHAFSKLKNQSAELILSAKEYHTWIATRTIFPEIENTFFNEFKLNISNTVFEQYSSTGLLSSSCVDGVIVHEFVHRTFAEYFVSEFLASNLKVSPGQQLQEHQQDQIQFFFENVLKTEEDYVPLLDFPFLYPNVVYFLNYHMTGVSISFVDHFIAKRFLTIVPPKDLYAVLQGILRACCGNVFNLIQNILLAMNTNVREFYKVELIPTTVDEEPTTLYDLLDRTSKYSNICLATQLFRFFLECFDCDLNKVCKRMSRHFNEITPLHFAVLRGDFELVQFFANSISLENHQIMSICRTDHFEKRLQVVNKKIGICEFLLSKNKNVNEMECPVYDAHVEMLKMLFRMGVNPRTIIERKTVVHRAAMYMTPSDYHELTRFLINECPNSDLFTSNEEKWSSPLNCILSTQESIEIRTVDMILDIPGVDVNEVDDAENTLFLSAVKGKQKEEILQRLIQLGVDCRAINRYAQGALHLAAENADLHTIQFLLGLGMDPDHVDMAGNTFLHYFAWNPISSEQYNQIIRLVVSAELTSIFHVENVLNQLPIHVAIRDVDVDGDTLKIIQENGVDLNSTDKDNRSLLMYAALGRRNGNLLQKLIKMGVDTNIRERDGNTFVHYIFKRSIMEFSENRIKFLIDDRGLMSAFVEGQNSQYFVSNKSPVQEDEFKNITDLRRFYGRIIEVSSREESNVNNISDSSAEIKHSRQFWKILKETGVHVGDNEKPESNKQIVEYYSFEDYHKILHVLNEMDDGTALLDTANNFGETPLDLAALDASLDAEFLKFIIEKFVDTNVVNLESSRVGGTGAGRLLINAAKGRKRLSLLKTLIHLGANVMIQDNDNSTFAHHYSKYCSAEEFNDVVQLLVELGHQNIFQKVNKKGASPLHLAVFHLELSKGTLDLIKCQLVETRLFDINSADSDGVSFLGYAVKGKRSSEFLKALMEMGADVMTRDSKGNTIAHWMPQYYTAKQYHEIIKLLFDRGQERVLLVSNTQGVTPFQLAVCSLELLPESVEHLFAKNTTVYRGHLNLNIASTSSGNSVLHWAIRGERSLEFVQHLVTLGADYLVANNRKTNLAHCSASRGLIHHLKYFVGLGCNINDLDNYGHDVLQYAVNDAHGSKQIVEIVEFLVKKGANKQHVDKNGKTAFKYAIDNGITDERILTALQ